MIVWINDPCIIGVTDPAHVLVLSIYIFSFRDNIDVEIFLLLTLMIP